MPEIGDIKRGREIGKRNQKASFIWLACVKCGRERWVSSPATKEANFTGLCHHCSATTLGRKLKNYGRTITHKGYVEILLHPDDFFFPMAQKRDGYVMEHRLVMAQHLGRCLQPWELVHHKGIRYTGIENRSDNLIDNLKLTTRGSHTIEHSKGYRDGYQYGYQDGLRKAREEETLRVTTK